MNSLKLIGILDKIGDKIIEQKDFLTELDRPIGDNDHGINMAKGFQAVKEKLPSLADKDLGTIFKTTGMTLVSTVGGSSGPLYGTLFMAWPSRIRPSWTSPSSWKRSSWALKG